MKKIVKSMLSLMMCFALMLELNATSASAAAVGTPLSWRLSSSLPSGAPTSINGFYQYTQRLQNNYGSTIHSMTSNCTSFSSTNDRYGNEDYAKLNVKIQDDNGNVFFSSGEYTHRSNTSSVTISFSSPFSYGRYCVPTYTLQRYTGVTASMEGTFRFYN